MQFTILYLIFFFFKYNDSHLGCICMCLLVTAFGVESMATAMDEDLEDELEEKEEKSMMCQPGMHKWKLDQCMVCTVCGDCTGYGASCVSSGRPDRVPGG